MKLWQEMFIIVFAGLIIFPSAVDLAHIFSGHKHDFCNHYAESHFHQETLDCKLFDFQKQPIQSPTFYSTILFDAEVNIHLPKRDYLYLSTYQKLHFSLRAPPASA